MGELDLDALALAILSERKATRSGPHGDRAATADALRERGYEPHAAALDFEARYGGLELREGDPAPSLVVGAYAFVTTSGYSRWPDGGAANAGEQLVPVMIAWNDVDYFIGADGRGWMQQALDGAARASARDGRMLVTQAILWRKLDWLAQEQGMRDARGRSGAERAAARGLPLIVEASSDGERWWGSAGALIVEIAAGNGSTTPITYEVGGGSA